jgi:hypothetical protein
MHDAPFPGSQKSQQSMHIHRLPTRFPNPSDEYGAFVLSSNGLTREGSQVLQAHPEGAPSSPAIFQAYVTLGGSVTFR